MFKPNITIPMLQRFIKFAKESGIQEFKLGEFECKLPPKDATKKELDQIKYQLTQLESITQRLSLQVDERISPRLTNKPFSERIKMQAGSKP